jgi:hypothetical protein
LLAAALSACTLPKGAGDPDGCLSGLANMEPAYTLPKGVGRPRQQATKCGVAGTLPKGASGPTKACFGTSSLPYQHQMQHAPLRVKVSKKRTKHQHVLERNEKDVCMICFFYFYVFVIRFFCLIFFEYV